jgi:hypothetical protein
VGYISAPFTERTIINSGYQSMPLEYNNTEAPFYSETIRSWDTARDWTVNGVDTLTLHLRGSSGNSQESLYIVVEDSAGAMAVIPNPDPDAIRDPLWAAWSIPLTSLSDTGLDLSSVQSMAIGLGDRANPSAGGSGKLYVDDIIITKSSAGG